MANSRALIKQSDAQRLLKAAQSTGAEKYEIIIDPDGTVRLVIDETHSPKSNTPNESFWEKELGE